MNSWKDVDCWAYHRPLDLIVSVLLVLGIVASYAPQHLKIIRDASSKGISHWFLFLGSLSSYSNLCNAAILQIPLFKCCQIVSLGQCTSNLIAVFQLLIQWSMNFLIFVLYFLYFPEEEKKLQASEGNDDDVQTVPSSVESPSWIWSKRIRLFTFVIMGLVTVAGLFIFQTFGFPSSVARSYSDFLGILSLVLSFFQFIPQIVKTYRLQEVGALSITSMLMQTPGSFLMSYTIAISPETTVFTWITYFVGGCLQGCLLLLCINLRWNQQRSIYIRVERYE